MSFGTFCTRGGGGSADTNDTDGGRELTGVTVWVPVGLEPRLPELLDAESGGGGEVSDMGREGAAPTAGLGDR